MSNFIYSLVRCIRIKKKIFLSKESKKWSSLLFIDWVLEENPQRQIIWYDFETKIV